jgi:hypothetical protein
MNEDALEEAITLSKIARAVLLLDKGDWISLAEEQGDKVDEIASDLNTGSDFTLGMREDLLQRSKAIRVFDLLGRYVEQMS